jgi:ribosomal protein L11 methyltransferase
MTYTKVAVKVTPYSADASDLLIALLGEVGFESFEENTEGFDGYIQTQLFSTDAINNIAIPIEGATFTFTSDEIADQNWNEVWEKNYFQPIIIDNLCVVRGPFHPTFPEIPYQILIEPKMSFGTGHHETTGLMMRFILENDLKTLRVLDMGCGTGILGILASMHGAANVVGIDIDQWSYDNSIENCQLNNVHNMTTYCGNASLLAGLGLFDMILANINRNILLNDLRDYTKNLKLNGKLFLSGFYSEDLEAINKEAQNQGLRFESQKMLNNWISASYTKIS